MFLLSLSFCLLWAIFFTNQGLSLALLLISRQERGGGKKWVFTIHRACFLRLNILGIGIFRDLRTLFLVERCRVLPPLTFLRLLFLLFGLFLSAFKCISVSCRFLSLCSCLYRSLSFLVVLTFHFFLVISFIIFIYFPYTLSHFIHLYHFSSIFPFLLQKKVF